jgi:hypothetical protein
MLKYKSKANDEFSNEDIKNVFGKLSEEQLISKSDVAGFKDAYKKSIKEISDTLLVNEISFLYYFQLSRYTIFNGKKDSVDIYLSKAYHLKPENAQIKGVISSIIFEKITVYSEANSVYKYLNTSKTQYPFLEDNENINLILSNCYLELSFQNFSNRNAVKGEEFLKKFETLLSEKNIKEPNEKFITRAYSEAAAHYYRVGNKVKANEKIKNGLMYYPDNFTLKEMQKQMN